jgi:hypothetical protein
VLDDGVTNEQETLIRRLVTILIAVLALVAVAVPAIAASDSVNVPRKFKKLIPKVSKKSGLPVLLPSTLRAYGAPTKVFGRGGATRRSYGLELGFGKNCNGANVCFVAAFFATEDGKPSFKRKVKLKDGRTGYFKPITCGASCSPAVIQWRQHDALYEIQYKPAAKNEKRAMVRLANSAIDEGPR